MALRVDVIGARAFARGRAEGFIDLPFAGIERELPIRIAQKIRRRRLGRGDHRAGVSGAHFRQRLGARRHQRIAADHERGFAHRDARRMQGLAGIGDLHMAHDRAAFLREAGHVEHRGRLAFEVGGHAEQLPDRDHAGAADAGDENAISRRGIGQRGFGYRIERRRGCGAGLGQAFAFAQLPTFDRHEARAEAVEAGIVLVARRLIDLAFATEFGLDRFDRQA